MEIRAPKLTEIQTIIEWYASHLQQRVSSKQLLESLKASQDVLWVAANGDMLCGFLHAVWSGGPYELIALVVEPRQRRQGIAREFMHTLLAELMARSAIELWLEVRADNDGAIGLYLETVQPRLVLERSIIRTAPMRY